MNGRKMNSYNFTVQNWERSTENEVTFRSTHINIDENEIAAIIVCSVSAFRNYYIWLALLFLSLRTGKGEICFKAIAIEPIKDGTLSQAKIVDAPSL